MSQNEKKPLLGKQTTYVNARARKIQEVQIRAADGFFHTEVLDFQRYHTCREHNKTHTTRVPYNWLSPTRSVLTKGSHGCRRRRVLWRGKELPMSSALRCSPGLPTGTGRWRGSQPAGDSTPHDSSSRLPNNPGR